jgi:HAD superfamily hydrolase (TIGR01509 family)
MLGYHGARPRLLRPVSGLLLDMGDVIHDTTVWRRWLLRVLARTGLLGPRVDYKEFCRVWDREYLGDVHRGRRDFRDAFRAFLASFGLTSAQVDEVERACQTRRRQIDADAQPLPGVRATLARLDEAGFALAVLSDSEHPSSVLEEQLERFGLGGVFVSVISSPDVGQTTPEPAGYLRSLRAMKLRADEAAFVGHDVAGLSGAAELGMQTIAFNYDPDATADAYLARFDELLDLVGARTPYRAAG